MLHGRADYQPIQDPRGLIPDDEPVFLIRGQDQFAVETLKFYASMCRAAGKPAPLVEAQIERMIAWPVKKVPNGPSTDGHL
jgi:hypothetical protein